MSKNIMLQKVYIVRFHHFVFPQKAIWGKVAFPQWKRNRGIYTAEKRNIILFP